MQKVPPKITATYLENAALHYLERFSASRAGLLRVMWRKIDRSIAHWGGERGDFQAQLDALTDKLTRLGYLNDESFARAKARSLHRSGKGTRLIAQTLKAKGIGQDDLTKALDDLACEVDDPDYQAALKLARKRRLGPFRPIPAPELRQKDMAALARAGFGFDIIRRVIELSPDDDMDFPDL